MKKKELSISSTSVSPSVFTKPTRFGSVVANNGVGRLLEGLCKAGRVSCVVDILKNPHTLADIGSQVDYAHFHPGCNPPPPFLILSARAISPFDRNSTRHSSTLRACPSRPARAFPFPFASI